MRRTLGTAAVLLVSGCLGDLINIGEGPDEKSGGGNATGGMGAASATSGTSGVSGSAGASGASDTGGDGGAGADSGGSTSNGGAATGGGTGGNAGNGGKGGGAGSSGSSGTSGASGTGEPTSDPDVIARAAVALGSCIGDDGVSRNASELWYWQEASGFWGRFRLQAACIADAGQGCGALDTCLGWRIEERPGCTPGRVCDGSRFRECVEVEGIGTLEQRFDCATLGLDCNATVVCTRSPAVACELTGYVDHCAGNVPQTCAGDAEGPPDSGVVYEGPYCDAFGLECVAASPGGDEAVRARCTGSGDACEFDPFFFMDGIGCAGSTLEACVNGRSHDFDCSMYGSGFGCQTYGGVPFCGLASECLPGNVDIDMFSQQGDPEPACDGTSIVFCNAGRLERIDCTSLGFTGCDLEAGLGCVPSPTSDFRP